MADRPRGASSEPNGKDFDATKLTTKFEQLMLGKRFNSLHEHSQSRSRSTTPTPSSTLPAASPLPASAITNTARPYSRGLPVVPAQPQDPSALKFRSLLHFISLTPTKYENPGLLDEALTVLPLDRLYSEAEEESQLFLAKAASVGTKPEWGYQDCVIRALLKWVLSCLSRSLLHSSY